MIEEIDDSLDSEVVFMIVSSPIFRDGSFEAIRYCCWEAALSDFFQKHFEEFEII